MNFDNQSNEQQHHQFLSRLVSIAFCLILTVIAFIIIIDPYSLYGWFKVDGINYVKPDLSRYSEEIKLTQAVKLKPDTLIFGNSRAEIGLDPESPSLIQRGYRAYNLAIRGTSIATSYRQLNHLIQNGVKPKRMFIALDFIDFMNPSKHLESSNKQMTIKKTDFPIDHWYWRFDILFSMASLKDAANTLLIQNDSEAASITERGFNPLREYAALARNEGYFVLFRQRAVENAKTYLNKASGRYDTTDFKYLRKILKSAEDNGIDVFIIIYPYHAQILALFEETGLLPLFIKWKKEIIDEIRHFSKSNRQDVIHVFDFSGYGEYQCERIPGKGDFRSSTQWYWEAGHFKKTLGDILLERVLTLALQPSPTLSNYPTFGVKLAEMNLESNLQRMHLEKERCVKVYPNLFKDAKMLVESIR